ncbi:autotransporter domain-containing protein [Bradyrhizobium diazoefficiens]|uniref:autotransporter outer membrane beta-barrel domain-containing protein n=1 Tax=Bradyrhizobium diazoefficiens TaxID=1355477 RepID=UPI00190E3571|nr:autotransporter domain-containing protein [Bradyrhizobium diazoefficiens]QQO36770.1 autotransporter domain-containing protein [Bradyrhizobium diazoefficiens]
MTNNAGASITGANAGVDGGSVNITNSGSIIGTAVYGIRSGTNATVINNAGASIRGGQYGIAANAVADVTNSGSITGTSTYGIAAGTDAKVTNNAGASISGGADGIVASSGFANVTNSGSIAGASTYGIFASTDATVTNAAGGSIAGGQYGIFTSAGSVDVTNSGSITTQSSSAVSAAIRAFSDATVINNAGGVITGGRFGIVANGFADVTNSGTISASAAGNGYAISGQTGVAVTNNAGASISGLGYGIFSGAGGSSVFNAGTISGGTNAIRFSGTGNTLTLAAGSVISGTMLGTGSDTFQLGGSAAATFDVSQLGAAAQYQGFGTFNKIDSSVWTLTGTSTYAGTVNVNGGILGVNGDLTSASSLTVNAGGTLGGNGIVGTTLVNGGTLAPGNSIGTLTVTGSLTLTAASTYLVQVSGSSADKTIVTTTANLAGKVVVAPLTRVAATTTFTILTAGTVNGSFSGADFLAASNFARNARLSYVGNDVLLTLDAGLLSPAVSGGNINQRNVATGIDNALTAGGAMPAGFNALFALSGNPLLNALTQASGETPVGAQQTTFDAMNLFMGVLTDPFVAGRGDPLASPGGATGYADSDALAYAAGRNHTGAAREAYAAIYRKAPLAQVYGPRWSVWAAGFGGSQATDGNATLGSNTTTSRIAGATAGADYWFSPYTVAGFALAGGGTSFSVANGGTGRSDLFQAGAFVRHNSGPAYVTAALAYGWQDVTTNRTVTIAGVDQLQARFNANTWSGRLEGGYRYIAPWTGGVGLTPYAAAQFTTIDLPAYAEQVLSGANTFALSYASKSVTATRSELGLRADKSFALTDAILALRGRAAWAHDFNADRAVAATFQALPGASFVVNGAAQAHDAALTTASAEVKLANGLSLAATFEGEFSDVTRSYAGKGTMRYAW